MQKGYLLYVLYVLYVLHVLFVMYVHFVTIMVGTHACYGGGGEHLLSEFSDVSSREELCTYRTGKKTDVSYILHELPHDLPVRTAYRFFDFFFSDRLRARVES